MFSVRPDSSLPVQVLKTLLGPLVSIQVPRGEERPFETLSCSSQPIPFQDGFNSRGHQERKSLLNQKKKPLSPLKIGIEDLFDFGFVRKVGFDSPCSLNSRETLDPKLISFPGSPPATKSVPSQRGVFWWLEGKTKVSPTFVKIGGAPSMRHFSFMVPSARLIPVRSLPPPEFFLPAPVPFR